MKYFLLSLVILIQACSDGGGMDPGPGLIDSQTFSGSAAGEAVSLEYLYSLNQETIDSKMTSASSVLSGIVTTGAHIYKLTYVTNDANLGDDTFNASGLLIIPYNVAESGSPWVVVSHGTIVDNNSAPTNNLSEGLFEAGLGFITLVPDYIGFGDSYSSDPSVRIHPYIIQASYGSDSVNMMKAAKSVLANKGISPGRLYLKGYSEGGYATLALQKELETNHTSEFTITASAPSAGPYTTVGLGAQLTTTLANTTISPTLFGFLATSYYYNYSSISSAYNLSSVFLQTESYDEANIFNGSLSSTQTEAVYSSLNISTINTLLSSDIVSAIGTQTSALAYGAGVIAAGGGTSNFQTAVASLTDTFSAQLYANDLMLQSFTDGYKPSVTTIFYHCSDDNTIYPSITSDSTSGVYAFFTGLGSSTVTKVDTATGGHGSCPYIFTPAICFAQIEGAGGSLTTLNAATSSTNYCN